MPLTLTLTQSVEIPLEVDNIQISQLKEKSCDEINDILIQQGNRQEKLGSFFDVNGSCREDDEICWKGDCSKVKLIGAGMSAGRMRIEGNVGMHLGAEMTGGEILVSGNATDWVGAEMKGGLIHIKGDAGHLVGAVYRGGRKGMTGGTILIEGNVGNEVGNAMRRGLIVVGKRCGDAAGFHMIAGSIFLFGETGIRCGAGMRRGTIINFSSSDRLELLPTFQYACKYKPSFLPFYLKQLQQKGFPVPSDCFGGTFERHLGDFLELGKGEILTRSA